MKYCNTCQKEFDDKVTTCPECGASFSDVLKSDHDFDDMVAGDFEMLTHIRDNVEADVFASYLEANGVKTYVHYEGNGPYKTLLLEPGLEGTAIFVVSDKLEEAKTLMDQFEYVHEE